MDFQDNLIPQFPKFTKLTIGHKDVMSEIINNFPSSDFNFVGLFTWDVTDSVMVSMLNDNLVIKSSDYISHQTFYSFLGNSLVDETAKELIAYSKAQGHDAALKILPESMAMKFEGSEWHVLTEDPANKDYILSVDHLVQFKTNMFRGKKNLLNRFTKTYGEHIDQKELDLGDDVTVKAIDKVLKDWGNKKGMDISDETIGIQRSIDHHKALKMRAFGVFYKKSLIAFTLFEVLPGKVAVIHFDKANTKFVGVFEHMKHSFAKHLASLDVEVINYEQDLGVEGLRKAKESYHPVRYIKKYTLTAK